MKTVQFAFLFFLISSLSVLELPAMQPAKPLPPVRASITPIPASLSPDLIKPGDTIAITVTAVSLIDAQDLKIEVHLSGGTKLVSGETTWNGPAAKGEEKSITLSVRAPLKGKGRVRAVASLPPSNGTRFMDEAVLSLGPEGKTRPQAGGVVKKDKKGRNIIEYQ